ncbi:unnamed protein product [Cyprideis torosa]|uniref:Mothers against decapentaplegic homolog n=1 Tax=Cyprideis torosa TaxID=163714 RepID=A0A7R8WHK7_9CRUS|nr:unnamed protein product [Cyprideis torosa]CAG0899455.1 unnamed protein product [Cyprideis torosa]
MFYSWRNRTKKNRLIKSLKRMRKPLDYFGSQEFKDRCHIILEKMSVEQLRALQTALRCKGAELGECLFVTSDSEIYSSKFLPHFVSCVLWRWPELLQGTPNDLVRLPICDIPKDGSCDCVNPFHYARLLHSSPYLAHEDLPPLPSSPAPPTCCIAGSYNQNVDTSSSKDEGISSSMPIHELEPDGNGWGSSPPWPKRSSHWDSGISNNEEEEGDSPAMPHFPGSRLRQLPELHGNPRQDLTPPSLESETKFSSPICDLPSTCWGRVAYWEGRSRVGRIFPINSPTMSIFWRDDHPGCLSPWIDSDGLCLPTLVGDSPPGNEVVAKTRQKIGLGVYLWRSPEDGSVWTYNRSMFPMFISSSSRPKSDRAVRLAPGWAVKALDPARSSHQDHQQLPHPPVTIQISFAKGWGKLYKRRDVIQCPCWLEVFLEKPAAVLSLT